MAGDCFSVVSMFNSTELFAFVGRNQIKFHVVEIERGGRAEIEGMDDGDGE